MSAHALVSGTLFRTPEQRKSKAGKPYVTATLKVKDSDGFTFWRLTAFSESVSAELNRLSEGDALSAQGALKAGLYTPPDGEARISLSIVADQILALRPPPREPRQRPARERTGPRRHRETIAQGPRASEFRSPGYHRVDAPAKPRTHGCNGDDPFGDAVPF